MMKKYLKPEAEYVEFESEKITDIGSGSGTTTSDDFSEDDYE